MQVEAAEQQPKRAERRLAARVCKTWKEASGDQLPSWEDISKRDLGKDRAFCFCVDLRVSNPEPYFVFMGESLEKLMGLYLDSAAVLPVDVMDLASRQMDEAALCKAPVTTSDTITLNNGKRIVFRSTLMPLSDDGVNVTHIFGALNGKGF